MNETIQVQHEPSVDGFADPSIFDPYTSFPAAVPFSETFVIVGNGGSWQRLERFDHIQLLNMDPEEQRKYQVDDPDDGAEDEQDIPYTELECIDSKDLECHQIAWGFANSSKTIPIGTTIQVIGMEGEIVYEETITEHQEIFGRAFGIAQRVGTNIRYQINDLWSEVKKAEIRYFDSVCTQDSYYSVLCDIDTEKEVFEENIHVNVSGFPVVIIIKGFQTVHNAYRYHSPIKDAVKIGPGNRLVSVAITAKGDSEIYLGTWGPGDFDEAVEKIKTQAHAKYKAW